MQTKILLHGGRLRKKDQRNDSYFWALSEGLDDGDKVLFIGFARESINVEREVFEREKNYILAQTDKKIIVEMATRENLIDQIKSAKSIEITGGSTPKLAEIIKGYPDFVEAIKGKTVAGSSAGAYLFSRYYCSSETGKVLQGLGVLPIKISGHMDNPDYVVAEDVIEKLGYVGDDCEMVLLDECDWIEKTVEL